MEWKILKYFVSSPIPPLRFSFSQHQSAFKIIKKEDNIMDLKNEKILAFIEM